MNSRDTDGTQPSRDSVLKRVCATAGTGTAQESRELIIPTGV